MQRSSASNSPNRLLAGLSHHSRGRLIASGDLVNLKFGDVLCEAGGPVRHAYFPTEGFVSLIVRLDDGAQLEIGMIGDEGMLGASLVLSTGASIQDLVVQGKGTAWRVEAAHFRNICRVDTALRALLDRYVYVLMYQLSQTAACAHFHSIDSRLARWLLMTRDRSHSNSFFLTHEFLSYMLGVRRAGVSTAANSFQDKELIRYHRGKITILQRSALERISCACYHQEKDTYRRILGPRRKVES